MEKRGERGHHTPRLSGELLTEITWTGSIRAPAKNNRHELAIAGFLGEHLAATGVARTNCRNGDEAAGEPDVVCQLGSERRGIEVVDCWYSGDDAKTVWGLVADLEVRGIRRTVASTSDFDDLLRHPSGDQLVAICQRALEGPHGMRRYGFPGWLILNASQAPLHSSSEGPYLVSWLKKPATWCYTDAYLSRRPLQHFCASSSCKDWCDLPIRNQLIAPESCGLTTRTGAPIDGRKLIPTWSTPARQGWTAAVSMTIAIATRRWPSRGRPPRKCSGSEGHATIAVTLDLYSHVVPSLQREAPKEMGAALLG